MLLLILLANVLYFAVVSDSIEVDIRTILCLVLLYDRFIWLPITLNAPTDAILRFSKNFFALSICSDSVITLVAMPATSPTTALFIPATLDCAPSFMVLVEASTWPDMPSTVDVISAEPVFVASDELPQKLFQPSEMLSHAPDAFSPSPPQNVFHASAML